MNNEHRNFPAHLTFSQRYGYTNDEQGIRHALLNKDAAEVGLDEALFMFGACASLKRRKIGNP